MEADANKRTVDEMVPQHSIQFDPSNVDSLKKLLSKYGPEGLYAIGTKLIELADKDVSDAMGEAERMITSTDPDDMAEMAHAESMIRG